MNDHDIDNLKVEFGDVAVRTPGELRYVRLAAAPLPAGCTPASTGVLLKIQGEGRPELFVQPGILCPGGQTPRSYQPVVIDGEGWASFSYNFPWDPSRDDLAQFVRTALLRSREP